MLEPTLNAYARDLAHTVGRDMAACKLNVAERRFSIQNPKGWTIDCKLIDVDGDDKRFMLLVETVSRYGQPVNIVTLRRHYFTDELDGRTFPVDAKGRSPQKDNFLRYHNKMYNTIWTSACFSGRLGEHLRHVMDVGFGKLERKEGISDEAKFAESRAQLNNKSKTDQFKFMLMSEEDYLTKSFKAAMPEKAELFESLDGHTSVEEVKTYSDFSIVHAKASFAYDNMSLMTADLEYMVPNEGETTCRQTGIWLKSEYDLRVEDTVKIRISSNYNYEKTINAEFAEKLVRFVNTIEKYKSVHV